jgi:ferredoxin
MVTTDAAAGRRSATTIDAIGLGALISELQRTGHEVHGPVVRDGVITHDVVRSADELPVGWTDEQSGGHYRLVERADGARFGYAVGPQSWKELLHPARTRVWSMSRPAPSADDEPGSPVSVEVRMEHPAARRRAFVGVKPCELAAIAKQDRVLLDGPFPDPTYRANRSDVFIVAVSCGDPADTCFCTSMGTGPSAGPGYDLALTELVDDHDVRYVVEIGSEAGADVLAALPSTPTTDVEWRASHRVVVDAADQITRTLDTDGIKEMLYANLESPVWGDVADRCLTCGNCTSVCPTCFCTDLVDVTDLDGDHSDRWRSWDSCFSLEFSHLGPGPLRASAAARYRQWMTHKLGSWIDQFGESGCVGCGRCITWCPVGIDLTAEARALRAGAQP